MPRYPKGKCFAPSQLENNSIEKDKWSPALQIRTVLLSIQALLSTPEPDDPLDAKIAEHWKSNKSDAEATARLWTKTFAVPQEKGRSSGTKSGP